MANNRMESGAFYCLPISHQDIDDIQKFVVINRKKAYGLERYLKDYALSDESAGLSRTYIVRDINDNMIVGYFSLKAGFIAAYNHALPFSKQFDAFPGVELSNFAVNQKYRDSHQEYSHIGYIIFSNFIMRTVLEAKRYIGISTIYLFALPDQKLIARYSDYGFVRAKRSDEIRLHRHIKPAYDKGCIFMYLNL